MFSTAEALRWKNLPATMAPRQSAASKPGTLATGGALFAASPSTGDVVAREAAASQAAVPNLLIDYGKTKLGGSWPSAPSA